MKQEILKITHLQLFAEGEGSAAPEAGAPEAASGEAAAETPRNTDAARRYGAWLQQAEAAKKLYPNLDLSREVKNPQFARLLRAGVDVASAYLVTHQARILPAAMHYAARTAEARVASRVAANRARPAENGIGTQSAAVTKTDVSRMTKADRQQIARRVAAGEKIRF